MGNKKIDKSIPKICYVGHTSSLWLAIQLLCALATCNSHILIKKEKETNKKNMCTTYAIRCYLYTSRVFGVSLWRFYFLMNLVLFIKKKNHSTTSISLLSHIMQESHLICQGNSRTIFLQLHKTATTSDTLQQLLPSTTKMGPLSKSCS